MKNQDAYGLADITVGQNNEWNELHFVDRGTFATMAPSVLYLEIGRLDRMIGRLHITDEIRNALITARHHLVMLRGLVTGDFLSADLTACDAHLSTAILSVGLHPALDDPELATTLDNIADRLGFVRERLRRLH